MADQQISLRGTSLASPTSERRSPRAQSSPGAVSNWGRVYPSWDHWTFQRTLTYWISVMYLEGSILFLTGSIFSMLPWVGDAAHYEHALVGCTYLMGGVCFTIGSYLGLVEALNAERQSDGGSIIRQTYTYFLPVTPSGWQALGEGVWGYLCYTIGAILYNVNTIAGLCKVSFAEKVASEFVPAVGGALGFTIGSAIECCTNEVWKLNPNFLTNHSWWLSVSNLIGSLGYLTASICMPIVANSVETRWLVNFPYVVGSFGFMVGSLCTMWLWKGEQFGLGFMPGLNNVGERPEPNRDVLSMSEEYGCGRASPWQLPFLTMYLVNATASVILVGLAVFWSDSMGGNTDWYYVLIEALLNFFLSHGVMLLGSIVHHVPSKAPHSWLLVYMRIVLTFYTVNSWLSVIKHISQPSVSVTM